MIYDAKGISTFSGKFEPGGGVCGLLLAKGFPWISPVGHILVLVPSFDRDFVMTFHGHGSIGDKMAPDLK